MLSRKSRLLAAAAVSVAVLPGLHGSIVPAFARLLPQDTVIAAVHAFGRSFGESREAIRATLGPPTRSAVRAVPNRHDAAVTDTAIAVWYPGLEFSMWWAGFSGRELLETVVLTGSSIPLPGEIVVSQTSPAELRTVLGEPNWQRQVADTLILSYLSPLTETDEWTHFHFVADSLRLVRWNYYVD